MTQNRIYLREWRIFRHLTQKQVVDRLSSLSDDRLPATEASLSRLETAKQPYSPRILEALSDIYACEPHELIGRNPAKAGDVIDMWGRMSEMQQAQARAVIEALSKETRTG